MIGGYDNGGGQRRTELFNVTTMKWSQLDPMPIGRGLHSCGLYQAGGVSPFNFLNKSKLSLLLVPE